MTKKRSAKSNKAIGEAAPPRTSFNEITQLLARGLVRSFAVDPHTLDLEPPTHASNDASALALDSSANQSVHAPPSTHNGEPT